MVSPIPQNNFDPSNLPSGTAGFYNTQGFAQNLLSGFKTEIGESDAAAERSKEEAQKAIDGQM